MANEGSLRERYFAISDRVASAAKLAGRNVDDISLIVVSKNHPASMVIELIELGATQFGENRDQEAAPKALEVASLRPLAKIDWHFIGQLQSNKVKSVLNYAGTVHSLDRPSLLQALAKESARLAERQAGYQLDVLIQLNVTDDPNRGGIAPGDLLQFCESVLGHPSLNLRGVMGVASLERDAVEDFETIAKASQSLQTMAPGATAISAGMSEDFEEAIGFGATHLRIGSAITGNRTY
jgi:hypothetical protein